MFSSYNLYTLHSFFLGPKQVHLQDLHIKLLMQKKDNTLRIVNHNTQGESWLYIIVIIQFFWSLQTSRLRSFYYQGICKMIIFRGKIAISAARLRKFNALSQDQTTTLETSTYHLNKFENKIKLVLLVVDGVTDTITDKPYILQKIQFQ